MLQEELFSRLKCVFRFLGIAFSMLGILALFTACPLFDEDDGDPKGVWKLTTVDGYDVETSEYFAFDDGESFTVDFTEYYKITDTKLYVIDVVETELTDDQLAELSSYWYSNYYMYFSSDGVAAASVPCSISDGKLNFSNGYLEYSVSGSSLTISSDGYDIGFEKSDEEFSDDVDSYTPAFDDDNFNNNYDSGTVTIKDYTLGDSIEVSLATDGIYALKIELTAGTTYYFDSDMFSSSYDVRLYEIYDSTATLTYDLFDDEEKISTQSSPLHESYLYAYTPSETKTYYLVFEDYWGGGAI